MTTVTCPSGAILKIDLAPFVEARNLYQAVLEEAKGLKLAAEEEVDVNLLKDLLCVGLSSKKIELALQPCLKRATYNDLKIDNDTFEPEQAREDYVTVVTEVAKANLLPFAKPLIAKLSEALGALRNSPKSE